MLHKMKLNESPFERIKNGTKDIEFRLFDEKRQQIKVGDQIEFSKLPDLQEKLLVDVTQLYREDTFEKLFKKLYNDEKEIKNTCNIIKEKYNKIDMVVNCAGVPGIQKLEEVSFDVLDNLMRINLLAPIFLITQLITLIKDSGADILNVGSTIGTKAGYPDQIAYTTSKWGIRGASYNLQAELKKYKSRVIQFNVGGMNTRMHTKYIGKEIEHPEEWMDPKEIAKLMLYILSLPKSIEISDITINRKVVK